MNNLEKEYVGKRDCEQCSVTSVVDITSWKDNEQWVCPICKSVQEARLD